MRKALLDLCNHWQKRRHLKEPVVSKEAERGSDKRACGVRGQSFTEPEGMEMSQDIPEHSSDSDSNVSTEELVRWTPSNKELSSYNQMYLH